MVKATAILPRDSAATRTIAVRMDPVGSSERGCVPGQKRPSTSRNEQHDRTGAVVNTALAKGIHDRCRPTVVAWNGATTVHLVSAASDERQF